jgi:hypothetical protein
VERRVHARFFGMCHGSKILPYAFYRSHTSPLSVPQIFTREHFFKGKDNEDQLYRIVKVLGTDAFERYMQKYDLHISVSHPGLLQR